MIHSLVYTVILTVVYTVMSMILTVCTAYPLTQKNLKGRNIFLVIFLITMYFSGGMIPDYLLIKELHLLDNFWALVLPGLISTYNMIILKTFFTKAIPHRKVGAILPEEI